MLMENLRFGLLIKGTIQIEDVGRHVVFKQK